MSCCVFDAYEGQIAGPYGYLSVEELLWRTMPLKILDSTFDSILFIAEGDAFMCFEDYLLVLGGF